MRDFVLSISVGEGCHIALCLMKKNKNCEKNKMANLYQEIHYPLCEASDRMVTVSVLKTY